MKVVGRGCHLQLRHPRYGFIGNIHQLRRVLHALALTDAHLGYHKAPTDVNNFWFFCKTTDKNRISNKWAMSEGFRSTLFVACVGWLKRLASSNNIFASNSGWKRNEKQFGFSVRSSFVANNESYLDKLEGAVLFAFVTSTCFVLFWAVRKDSVDLWWWHCVFSGTWMFSWSWEFQMFEPNPSSIHWHTCMYKICITCTLDVRGAGKVSMACTEGPGDSCCDHPCDDQMRGQGSADSTGRFPPLTTTNHQ